MFNRRKILGGLALGPLAAKETADQLIAKQASVGLPSARSFAPNVPPGAGDFPTAGGMSYEKEVAILRKAYGIPAVRREMESIAYESERHVPYLDPDIAAFRSFSLNAKIVYQRQRNVERALQRDWLEYHPYAKKKALIARLAKTFLGIG